MSENKNALNLQPTHIVFEKRSNISDDEMDKVVGGFKEWGGYAAGYEIKCPACGRSKSTDFSYQECPDTNLNAYQCVCGKVFGVDSNGGLWQ